MDSGITRRAFLALSASGLSLGAVGHFNAPPMNTPHRLPPQWELLERALVDDRIGAIDYAHIAFAPERPADLWAILAMLHAAAQWSKPRRVSVIAQRATAPELPPVPFIGTIEIDANVRITVDGRENELRTSAVHGARGRLVIFPARAEFVTGRDSESQSIGWKTSHEYAPPHASAIWSQEVCEALRQAARDRGAIGFSESGERIQAPGRALSG